MNVPTASVLARIISYRRSLKVKQKQPPLMYLASLNAMFADMREAGVALENIVTINTSGQQHGHVYLNRNAAIIFSNLQRQESSTLELKNAFSRCFSRIFAAPIWMTANTVAQTDHVREAVGGKNRDD